MQNLRGCREIPNRARLGHTIAEPTVWCDPTRGWHTHNKLRQLRVAFAILFHAKGGQVSSLEPAAKLGPVLRHSKKRLRRCRLRGGLLEACLPPYRRCDVGW